MLNDYSRSNPILDSRPYQAKTKGLGIVAGTQRRHQASYLRTKYEIDNGGIGKILGGQVWWCGGALWFREQKPNEPDAEYMVRN